MWITISLKLKFRIFFKKAKIYSFKILSCIMSEWVSRSVCDWLKEERKLWEAWEVMVFFSSLSALSLTVFLEVIIEAIQVKNCPKRCGMGECIGRSIKFVCVQLHSLLLLQRSYCITPGKLTMIFRDTNSKTGLLRHFRCVSITCHWIQSSHGKMKLFIHCNNGFCTLLVIFKL